MSNTNTSTSTITKLEVLSKQKKKFSKDEKSDLLSEIIDLHFAIGAMRELASLNQGKLITHGEGDEKRSIDPKVDIPEAEKRFVSALRLLSNMKTGKPVDSSKRKNGLTEAFLQLTGPLKTFIETADFGFLEIDAKSGKKLVDTLPHCKKGYMSRLTFTYLVCIYVRKHGLQHADHKKLIVPDAAFNKAVNSEPATFSLDEDGKLEKNTSKKSTMAIIKEVEQSKAEEGADLQHFTTSDGKTSTIKNPTNLQSIMKYNSVSSKDNEAIENYVNLNKEAIMKEHEIVKALKLKYDSVPKKYSSVTLVKVQ